MEIKINRQLQAIEDSLNWVQHVPFSEQLDFKKKLINYRRELKKIHYAVSERCSAAAFGESQMGKSYLVSAMLSTPSHPFSVTDDGKQYDFISEINPSHRTSTIEATGVITRFTVKNEEEIPQGFLRVQLLSIPDIILILCEAYYNHVDYNQKDILSKEEIDDIIENIVLEKPNVKQQLLSVDDILDIEEYLQESSLLRKKNDKLLSSRFFNFLIQNIQNFGEKQLLNTIQILWNKEPHIERLWTDMIDTYRKLEYKTTVYTRFDSVLKRKGTLLDVARLDEMYGEPEDIIGSEFEPHTEIKTEKNGNSIKLEKSFFSSLIAEICFCLPKDLINTHPFLKELDILDFPGARRPEQIKQDKLDEGKNLSTVLRRGKVTYLFNKYSSAKRINTLLFCHNNSMSGESSMGDILEKWVETNIGIEPKMREEYVEKSNISPLFIIGTWFNKDLEYADEKDGDIDSLNARWNRRFKIVLEKEVLKSLDDNQHWFNNWRTSIKPFQNIYMLRDFKYSKGIYQGYDPMEGKPEVGGPIVHNSYPNFFSDLKTSFLTNDFVKMHFENSSEAWDTAATCAQDGSKRIIGALNTIAPNVAEARKEKFNNDIKKIITSLSLLLSQYYHPETNAEQLKLAKRQAGTARFQLDRMVGHDSYSFGRLMDTMMISEAEIYELVHSLILGNEQSLPMTNEETAVYMGARLDTSKTREENIKCLCDYLGVDSEDECQNILDERGIDLDNLLSQSQMITSQAGKLVKSVENLWYDKVLMSRTVKTFERELPAISSLMSLMWSLYNILDVRKTLEKKVGEYITMIDDKGGAVSIISDYLSMQFNKFSSSFGYSFMTLENKKRVLSKNAELNLNIAEFLLEEKGIGDGVNLLEDLFKQKEILSSSTFTDKDYIFLARFPQYKCVWRWEQQLLVAYIFASDLPDYDVEANKKLGVIINNLKE